MARRLASVAALLLLPSVAAAGGFFTLEGHGGPIRGIDVSGDRILTASFDNSAGFWRDGTPVWLEAHRAAVNAVRFLDGDRAVTGGDDFDIHLWNLSDGTARRLGRHENRVVALAVSPDGRTVASAGWDGAIGLWTLDGRPGRLLRGHASSVNDVAFSSDGSRLYSASADGTIRFWDPAAGAETRVFVKGELGINAIVPNDEGGWLAYGSTDGAVRVAALASGRRIAAFAPSRRPVLALAADAGFGALAAGDGDGFIKIIDCANWSVARSFRAAARGPVWALRFSADGRNIHAGGLDDAMYSWPTASLGEHRRMALAVRSFLRDPASMSNGERQFQRKCSVCHELDADGRRRAGPTLLGLFGRPAGSLAGYRYSRTLRDSSIVWNDDTINALFDLGPDRYIPGSKMPMQRIVDPADRSDLISFLKRATTGDDR